MWFFHELLQQENEIHKKIAANRGQESFMLSGFLDHRAKRTVI